MRSLLVVVLNLALAAGASAQDRTQQYSNPVPPSRAALDRLNMRQAWMSSVEMDGQRDALISVEPFGQQLLIQTRSGLTALLDAETGRPVWQVRVGVPYRNQHAPTMNSYVVLTYSNGVVYGLDRASGKVLWETKAPSDLSAPIVVDEQRAFLCVHGGRVLCYRLPRPDLDGISDTTKDPVPLLLWSGETSYELNLPPVVGGDTVALPGRNGRVTGYIREPRQDEPNDKPFRFSADAGLLRGPGVYGDVAYVGSEDTSVYAINMRDPSTVKDPTQRIPLGRTLWRYSSGAPVTRRPIALEKDVYVVSGSNGMARLDRSTGAALWKVARGREVMPSNSEADRFLAANPKFVYAADKSGNLVVLARDRGTLLSTMDTRDWVFPVANEYTDRLFLAANNGVILCLHDRDYSTPIIHRKVDTSGSDPANHPYDKSVHLDIRNQLDKDFIPQAPLQPIVPLRPFLEGLSKQYDLRILIRDPVFDKTGKQALLVKGIRTTDFKGKTVGAVLDSALEQAGCDKLVLDRILIFPILPKEKPDDKAPMKPDDKAPMKPDDKAPMKPDDKPGVKPDDKPGVKPEEKKN